VAVAGVELSLNSTVLVVASITVNVNATPMP